MAAQEPPSNVPQPCCVEVLDPAYSDRERRCLEAIAALGGKPRPSGTNWTIEQRAHELARRIHPGDHPIAVLLRQGLEELEIRRHRAEAAGS